MESFILISIVTAIAGIGGTGMGGVLGSLFRKSSNRVISLLLAATSGVMIAIVCFDLLTEGIEAAKSFAGSGAVLVVGATVLLGLSVVALLNYVIDRTTRSEVPHTAAANHPEAHDDIDELSHTAARDPKRDLWIAGVVIGCAIALHNIPEGMSIGASYAIQDAGAESAAFILAVLIGLHNIPEGMAVAVPLIAGGMGRLKAVLLTAASGAPIVLGAWLGLWLGDIGAVGLSCSLGFASGAMLYVVFGEIIPQAVLMYRSKLPAFFVIVGILIGMGLIYL